MRIAVFDTHSYDRHALVEANAAFDHELTFFEARLTEATIPLAGGFPAVCVFVNDRLDANVLRRLCADGLKVAVLRSAGYNNVDLSTAGELGIPVLRVPEYSPFAVAEHAMALLLSLNRKLHRAFSRVREANFSLDGLVGFDLHGKTVGIVGTGRIGAVFAQIARGFGCRVLAYDTMPNPGLAAERQVEYVDFGRLCRESDVISLHVPLTPATRHIVDAEALGVMKAGVIIINTGRGALIDTPALIASLKQGHIGAAGLDVYEEEEGIFFSDLSGQVLQDDVLARLLTFPNVLVTSHQAFLTREALSNIAQTTLGNVRAFERGETLVNEVRARISPILESS
jgi:D-lactate dehydrogenase